MDECMKELPSKFERAMRMVNPIPSKSRAL